MLRKRCWLCAILTVLVPIGMGLADGGPDPTLVETLVSEFGMADPSDPAEYLPFIGPLAEEVFYDEQNVLTLIFVDEEAMSHTVKVGLLTVLNDGNITFNASADGHAVNGSIERTANGEIVATPEFTLLGITLFEVPFALPQIVLESLEAEPGGDPPPDSFIPGLPEPWVARAEKQRKCECFQGTGWCKAKDCDPPDSSCRNGLGDCKWQDIPETCPAAAAMVAVPVTMVPLTLMKVRRRRRTR